MMRKFLRLPVGADHPAAAEMVGAVFDVALARRQHRELASDRPAGAQRCSVDTVLSTDDADELVVAAASDAHVEAVVLFLVDQRVGRGRRTQHVRFDAHGEQRFRILLDVEQRLVVVRPDHVGGHASIVVGIDLAGRQVLETDHVLAAADRVLGPGQQLVVLADLRIADAEIALALGHRG